MGKGSPAAAGGGWVYREGLRGSGPSMSSTGPSPRVLYSLGGGTGMCLPPGVCQSGGMGSYWSRSPPSESPKCLEIGGAVEWGGWAGVQTGQQGLGLPCLPTQPLGHVLSCQVLLQVPVFWRPHSAGVWGAQGSPRPSVFLGLRRLLFDLYLVAAKERVMWIRGCQGLPFLPQTDPEVQSPAKIPPSLPQALCKEKRGRCGGNEEEESLGSWRESR